MTARTRTAPAQMQKLHIGTASSFVCGSRNAGLRNSLANPFSSGKRNSITFPHSFRAMQLTFSEKNLESKTRSLSPWHPPSFALAPLSDLGSRWVPFSSVGFGACSLPAISTATGMPRPHSWSPFLQPDYAHRRKCLRSNIAADIGFACA